MRTEYSYNPQLAELTFHLIDRDSAKRLCQRFHYMRTYPQGAYVNFGIFFRGQVVGVCVFGYSSSTLNKVKATVGIEFKKNEVLEMQRLWISDEIGENAESYSLARIIDIIREKTDVRLIITHAGGCKNDCGIVYQAAAWLYFGRKPCRDFYLTRSGEYKNIASALRFGRVSSAGKTPQQVGEELFGPGEIVDSWRYYYVYPLNKGLRRKLEKLALPYVKESAHFRLKQQWVS